MLKLRISKNRAARQLEPKVLSHMKRSLAEQLAGFRGTRSTDQQRVASNVNQNQIQPPLSMR